MATTTLERQPVHHFTEKAYLNYAMYVILDRALPYIGDGLKPVQRRILYAMSELDLNHGAKFKKSARTIGDVIGKYHPHGDAACYQALALMAQPFSLRYPLIEGQGNFGSADDPKSFAAMRYTEARLTPYAEALLSELKEGTVEWGPNFDGTMQEPELLPARLPNLLLNGTTGIAVGMATDVPPHNLREVVNACIFLLDNPDATIAKLCQHIKGPDFPTSAEIITPRKDIHEMYAKGNGSIRMRAIYKVDDGDIVITALPYQVSGSKVLEQIANEMQAKKLPMIADLRDESDHEHPTRLRIILRSNRVEIEPLMSHLFATTSLEHTYRVNLNIIGLDGNPQVKDLKTLLEEWLTFRKSIVKKRLQFRLDKINNRLHLLEGFLVAYLNLDKIIAIIRKEDNPKAVLMQRFKLSERQVEAILEIRLRQLAKLEEIKIREEQKALAEEAKEIEAILKSSAKLKTLIRTELEEDAKKYGDNRRSPVVSREEAKAWKETDMLPTEPVTIILSQQGWIRCAKGHEIDPTQLKFKAGDTLKEVARGQSNQSAIFMDSTGRSYTLPAHTIADARGFGEPLTGKLQPPIGATFESVLMSKDEDWLLLASTLGYGFLTQAKELVTKLKAGKAVVSVPDKAKLLPPVPVASIEQSRVIAISQQGHMLAFPLKELPQLTKGKGNKIIQIPTKLFETGEESLVHITVMTEQDQLRLQAGRKNMTLTYKDLSNYQGSRGSRSLKLPQGLRKLDSIEIIRPTK